MAKWQSPPSLLFITESVMDASLIVGAHCVAGLALSGGPRGTSLVYRRSRADSELTPSTTLQPLPPAHTPQPLVAGVTPSHTSPSGGNILVRRLSLAVSCRSTQLTEGEGCCHGNQSKSRLPCWYLLFQHRVSPFSKLQQHQAPCLFSGLPMFQRGEGRVFFLYLTIF